MSHNQNSDDQFRSNLPPSQPQPERREPPTQALPEQAPLPPHAQPNLADLAQPYTPPQPYSPTPQPLTPTTPSYNQPAGYTQPPPSYNQPYQQPQYQQPQPQYQQPQYQQPQPQYQQPQYQQPQQPYAPTQGYVGQENKSQLVDLSKSQQGMQQYQQGGHVGYPVPDPQYQQMPFQPQPYGPLPAKDPNIAFLLELIGYLGFLGIGHIYAGNVVGGILMLIFGWFVVGSAGFLFTVLTLGIGVCVALPVLALVPIASGLWAKSIAQQNNRMSKRY